MISVREVDPNLLAQSARTWQNLHLAYTHGYGMVAVQVNTSVREGLPDFIVSEFDTANARIPLDQPRVYFGEPPPNAPEYVVAKSAQPEFDGPSAGQTGTDTSSYDGTGGVPLTDITRRLAFALRFRDVNLLISGNIKSDSRLMFNRDIRDRVELAAPFLQWDGDPYAAVVDGRLKFIRDGYTTYHIGNPDDFYSKDDFWALPDDRSGELQRQEDTGGLTTTVSVKARPYYLLTN